MKTVALVLASGFGSGYFPIASGTAGSAVGVALFAALAWSGAGWAVWAGLVFFTLVGFWAADVAERHYGGTDPGKVVIDEIAGQFVTLLLLPATIPVLVVGFFLFRILDIIKPFPARRLEALHGGTGIMLDDLVAGLYANLILQVLVRATPFLEWSGRLGEGAWF